MAVGDPFHVDLHIDNSLPADPTNPDGTFSANGTVLFNPSGGRYRVRRLTVSTDTNQRIVVGAMDQTNQRVRGLYVNTANGGADLEVCVDYPGTQILYIWHDQVSNIDVAAEGEYS